MKSFLIFLCGLLTAAIVYAAQTASDRDQVVPETNQWLAESYEELAGPDLQEILAAREVFVPKPLEGFSTAEGPSPRTGGLNYDTWEEAAVAFRKAFVILDEEAIDGLRHRWSGGHVPLETFNIHQKELLPLHKAELEEIRDRYRVRMIDHMDVALMHLGDALTTHWEDGVYTRWKLQEDEPPAIDIGQGEVMFRRMSIRGPWRARFNFSSERYPNLEHTLLGVKDLKHQMFGQMADYIAAI